MTNFAWHLVGLTARLLERDEREVVLGDVLESGESTWLAWRDVLGLVLRRQVFHWKDWRPWLATFLITIPASFLLMGVSLSVTCTAERVLWHRVLGPWLPTGHEGYGLLLCHAALLVACAWAAGFLVGSLSRQTVWISATLCLLPSVSKFPWHFPMDPLLRASLLLFLLPAMWGVRQALRSPRISLSGATALAAGVTMLMLFAWNNDALWVYNWFLLLPVWFIVVVAQRDTPRLYTAA